MHQNPYSISFVKDFEDIRDKPLPVVYNHYMYSPLMFIVNMPFASLSEMLFGFSDFRLALVVFTLLAAWVGTRFVAEKLLFLILFLLNPLFLPLTFYGANEAIILFFIISCIVALSLKKFSFATILLALATGTKLLAVPFVPIYFMYLYLKSNKDIKSSKSVESERLKITLGQLAIFVLASSVIYAPFLVLGPKDLIEDVIFYHLRGGTESHVIAGFLGVPGVLNNIGLISSTSTFPFYIFQLIIAFVALPFFKGILKRSFSVSMLCVAYFFYFSLLILFSRIIQTSYIAFLSQILLLAAFVGNIQMSTDNKNR